jgi:hypothetical protein
MSFFGCFFDFEKNQTNPNFYFVSQNSIKKKDTKAKTAAAVLV